MVVYTCIYEILMIKGHFIITGTCSIMCHYYNMDHDIAHVSTFA